MRVIIIGGTGATGKELVREILDNQNVAEVVALVRTESLPSHPKLTQEVVNFNELENYRNLILGDVAISTLGTTIKDARSKANQWKIDHDLPLEFARIAKQNNIQKFLLLSAVGVDPNSKIFYNKMKGMLEKNIKKLDFEQLFIFQPGMLIRPNSDRLGEKLMIPVLSFFNQFGLLKKYEALHVNEVAKAMNSMINQKENTSQIFDVKAIKMLSSKT